MEPTLEHDAKTKSVIKDALYMFLYAPVIKQFKGRLETLIERNTIICGTDHKHFIYKGVLYNGDTTVPPMKRTRLVAALRAPMDDYLRDLSELNDKELPYVLGFINQVLNSSNDLTDYMRVLPESIHYPLKKLMATCPCRATHLSEERVDLLKTKNQTPITLMKQRMVTNLLI